MVNGAHVILPSGVAFDALSNDYSLIDARQWYDVIEGQPDVRSYALLNELEEFNKLNNMSLLPTLQQRVANIQSGSHLRIEMPVYDDSLDREVAIKRCVDAGMDFVANPEEVSCNLPQRLVQEVKKVEPERY